MSSFLGVYHTVCLGLCLYCSLFSGHCELIREGVFYGVCSGKTKKKKAACSTLVRVLSGFLACIYSANSGHGEPSSGSEVSAYMLIKIGGKVQAAELCLSQTRPTMTC